MKKGVVVAVNMSKEKGTIKKPVPEIVLQENFGVVGDAHGGAGIRQVSFLGVESVEKLKNREVLGLCDGKFAENITTKGLILYEIPIGTKLQIADTILEVSQIGKKCHMGCEIQKLVGECIMPKEGIFACVIKGGKIKAGDEIFVMEDRSACLSGVKISDQA